jgi:predicted nucleic acid-binding protein
MLLVLADTSPIRYLVQIDQIQLLPLLFRRILIPSAVAEELRHPSGPPPVRAWIKSTRVGRYPAIAGHQRSAESQVSA